MTLRRTMRALLLLVAGLALVLDLAYFVSGSQELFPTAEQEATVRLVSGLAAVALAVFGWLLLRTFRRGA